MHTLTPLYCQRVTERKRSCPAVSLEETNKFRQGPEVKKRVVCSKQQSMKFQLLIKTKNAENTDFSCFQLHKSCIYHIYKC